MFIFFQNGWYASLNQIYFLKQVSRDFGCELSLGHLHFDFFHCQINFSFNQYFDVFVIIFNAAVCCLFFSVAVLFLTILFYYVLRFAFIVFTIYLAARGLILFFTLFIVLIFFLYLLLVLFFISHFVFFLNWILFLWIIFYFFIYIGIYLIISFFFINVILLCKLLFNVCLWLFLIIYYFRFLVY